MSNYTIGDIQLKWNMNELLFYEDEFIKAFRIKQGNKAISKDIVFKAKYENMGMFIDEKLLQKNGLYELYETSRGNFIIYHWATCRFAFGFYLEDLEKSDTITYYFNPAMKNEIPLDMVRFFSCAGIHSKLLQREAVVFHSSYIDWNGHGILFCGPSGIGKSTQADLWEKYTGAAIINGDRTLLKCRDGIWHSYGYPCCGSSGICINRTLPLLVIVVLEQGVENRIENMTVGQKMKTLISGSERYLWSEVELERVYQISEKIVSNVPIIKFICRPDENAVNVLKKRLEVLISSRNSGSDVKN